MNKVGKAVPTGRSEGRRRAGVCAVAGRRRIGRKRRSVMRTWGRVCGDTDAPTPCTQAPKPVSKDMPCFCKDSCLFR